jgi:hypothetical protein
MVSVWHVPEAGRQIGDEHPGLGRLFQQPGQPFTRRTNGSYSLLMSHDNDNPPSGPVGSDEEFRTPGSPGPDDAIRAARLLHGATS